MKKWLLAALAILAAVGSRGGTLNVTGAPAKIEIVERLDNQVYFWPETLLSYKVRLNGVKTSDLILTDANGKQLPIQWSDVTPDAATLWFMSDLPSGATKRFTLQKGVPEKFAAPEMMDAAIVKSQQFAPGAVVPGPFSALRMVDGKGAVGESRIESPEIAVRSVKSEPTASGPLFRSYRVVYTFANGATYAVNLRFVRNYDFIEFDDTITGLKPEDQVRLLFSWKNLPLEYRCGARGIRGDESRIKIDENLQIPEFSEDPRWLYGHVEDVSKEMYMWLAPYAGNGIMDYTPCASFWQDNGAEIGIFVRENQKWIDPDWGIWQPTRNLMGRFFYKDKTLNFVLPLTAGSRSLGINYMPTAKSEKFLDERFDRYLKNIFSVANVRNHAPEDNVRYNQILAELYGNQSLNLVKDWTLEYNGKTPAFKPDRPNRYKKPDDFTKAVLTSALMFYPLGQNSWVNSIEHRDVYNYFTGAYLTYRDQLPEATRRKLDALFLYSGHVTTNDSQHAIRSGLAGCPNMNADGWVVPMVMAFLFPEHPRAKEWREYYQKYWEVSCFFYTRPEVKAYDSKGGRWTESFGVYNWAHLAPTMTAHSAGFSGDQVNRIATDAAASRGRWLVDSATSPVVNPHAQWRMDWRKGAPKRPDLTNEKPERHYPSIGAHNAGSTQLIPSTVRHLGYFLRNYDPMTTEALYWLDAKKWMENKSGSDFNSPLLDPLIGDNRGTDPELETTKYTGYGINFRHGVGTGKEVFVYLSQVDAGPNYRWGMGSQGSTGSLYFTAGGKTWTGHENEENGDHNVTDAEGSTGFAVAKDMTFRSIGQNVLDAPLFDLGVAQLGTLRSRPGADAYSWPEYKSRSLLLVGGDYFILHDVSLSGQRGMRFSWFVPKGEEFPDIFFLNPIGSRDDHLKEVFTRASMGFVRDIGGSGDHQALVTHRKGEVKLRDYNPTAKPFTQNKIYDLRAKKRNVAVTGIYHVDTPESGDTVFQLENGVKYDRDGVKFSGKDGVLRRFKNGELNLALFGKGEIAADGFGIGIDSDFAAAGLVARTGALSGRIHVAGDKPASIRFDFVKMPGKLYLNGRPHVGDKFLPGKYEWEYTAGLPTPDRPAIERTENVKGGGSVFFAPVAGADKYLLEVSRDNGKTFEKIAEGSRSPLTVSGLENGRKVHLRVVAANTEKTSRPSKQYPLYVTDKAPAHPDGLMLRLGENEVRAHWGEVLGATAYSLYRRDPGATAWRKVYSGTARNFTDKAPGVEKARHLPGADDNPEGASGKIYDYRVSASNGNGEGVPGEIVTSDPASWLNWEPPVPWQFRRQSEYVKAPHRAPGEVPPMFYPN